METVKNSVMKRQRRIDEMLMQSSQKEEWSNSDNEDVTPESVEKDKDDKEEERRRKVQNFYGKKDEPDPESPYKNCEHIVLDSVGRGTEAGFYRVSEKDNQSISRWWYRCAASMVINGQMKFCDYRVRESSWLRMAPDRRGVHQAHNYTITASDRDDEKSQSSGDPACLKGAYADVYRLLCRNVCKMNISLENGASAAMFEPIWKACEIYEKQCQQRRGSRVRPSDALKKICPQTMRRIIIKEAEEEKERQLSSLYGMNNACICIDAGTAGSLHIIEVIINHHGTEVHLCTLDVSGQSMDGKNYAQKALEILRMCQRFHIHVLCFVGDGLQAQLNGLDGTHSDAFQRLSTCPREFRSVFFFPCMLHRINLIIPHAKVKYQWFKKALDEYHQMSIALRRNDSRPIISQRCPLLVATRWVYAFDVTNFIYIHRVAIREWAGKNKTWCTLLDMVHDYRTLFAPMKALVLSLSARTANISHVYPCIMACMESWRDLEFTTNGHVTADKSEQTTLKELRSFLVQDLSHQTTGGDIGKILMLAYALSHRGHAELWLARHPELDTPLLRRKYLRYEPWIDMHRLLARGDEDIPNETEEDTPEEDDSDDGEWQDESEIMAPEGEAEDCAQFDDDDDAAAEVIDLLRRRAKGIYDLASKGIEVFQRDYRKIRDNELEDELKRELHKWLETHPADVPYRELSECGGVKAWEEVRRSSEAGMGDDGLQNLACVAAVILSIPASEISCERSFSVRNYISTARSRRAKKELLTGRLVLLNGR